MKSENINELATALAKFQGVVEPVLKNKKNPFFKSNYADILALRESCKAQMAEHGLSVVQTTALAAPADGAVLTTTLLHSSGQWIEGHYPIKAIKQDPQGIGSAITYARRYAFAAILGLVTDEDDDGEKAMGRHEPMQSKPVTVNGKASNNELVLIVPFGKNKGKTFEEAGIDALEKSMWAAQEGLTANSDWVQKVGPVLVQRFIDDATSFLMEQGK